MLTDVVPTSVDCPYDVVSNGCFAVPPKPVDCSGFSLSCNPMFDTSIDGKRTPHEYDGATILPYTDQRYKSESKVYVRAFKETGFPVVGGGTSRPVGYLKVFFEDMPVLEEGSSTGTVGRAPDPFYAVFVDHDRFTGADASVDSHDVFYLIDIRGALPAVQVRRQANGAFAVTGFANYHAAKSCTQESAFLWRCNGELRIPLSADDLAPFPQPNQDVQPGIGFEAFPFEAGNTGQITGGLPEHTVATTTLEQLTKYRTLAMSLLFGKPKGFDADFMTWNIRRSSTKPLAGAFKSVADSDVGTWIGMHTGDRSIVGLQEGWDKDKMKTVLDAANEERVAHGKTKLYWAGPPDFSPGPLRNAVQDVAGIFMGNDGTNGGIYTVSALPVGEHAFHVYSTDACKGEDCFKGKGVLWTRIILNPSTASKAKCELQSEVPCDQPPSGDEYVDVFNTHLNATDPELCKDSTKFTTIVSAILVAEAAAPLAPAAAYLVALEENGLNCDLSDREVHQRQLDEMNAFIEAHASPDRPSIIMGDFNIDGRQLGDQSSEYREILTRLHIGPQNPQALPFANNPLDVDDLINRWPFDHDWDVDHGDLARARFGSFGSPYPADGKCMGTFVGGGSLLASGCYIADNADGALRYDYILIRPPTQSDDPNFKAAKWIVEKQSNDSLWHSPYPGPPAVGNQFSGPPARLSDHKPVVSSLALAKLAVPPLFHPNWKHTVEFRVASADASNRGDASGPVDLKVQNYGGHVPLSGGQGSIDKDGDYSHVCQDHASVSWPADGCMDNWNWPNVTHDGQQSAQFYGSYLWDDDNTSGDDSMPLENHDTQPVMAITWTNPAGLGLVGWDGQNLGTQYYVVHDTAAISISTITPAYGGPTSQTLRFKAVELPPDQQF